MYLPYSYATLVLMKETDESIDLLRSMSAVLRERKSDTLLSEFQRNKCAQGIIALDKAVEALQAQVHA